MSDSPKENGLSDVYTFRHLPSLIETPQLEVDYTWVGCAVFMQAFSTSYEFSMLKIASKTHATVKCTPKLHI